MWAWRFGDLQLFLWRYEYQNFIFICLISNGKWWLNQTFWAHLADKLSSEISIQSSSRYTSSPYVLLIITWYHRISSRDLTFLSPAGNSSLELNSPIQLKIIFSCVNLIDNMISILDTEKSLNICRERSN